VAVPSKVSIALIAIGALAWVVPRAAPAQNIKIDGSLSRAQTLTGPNYAIGGNVGKQVGANLFHSFAQFRVVKAAHANDPPVAGRVKDDSNPFAHSSD